MTCEATKGVYAPSTWWHDADVIHQRAIGEWRTIALAPPLPQPPADAFCDFRRLPRRFDLDRCLSLHYQRVVNPDHTVTPGAHSIALPPLPGHRGYAG